MMFWSWAFAFDLLPRTYFMVQTCDTVQRNFHLQVFSRWSELVFESRDSQKAWDGTYKGEPMKANTYTYQFRVTLSEEKEVERSGSVTLLR